LGSKIKLPMKYYECYEKIYSSGPGEGLAPNQSLIEFYSQEIKKRLPLKTLNVLEIGCGTRSIFASLDGDFEVLGIDISPSAIKLANQKNDSKYIKYENIDVTSLNLENQFDLVIDSHCLHCLTDPGDREKALKNIYASLKPSGIFALETMTSQKLMSFENPYRFEDNVLYRLFTNASFVDLKFFDGAPFLPIRRIDHALKIEEDILKAGFKIIFLYVFSHKKIIPDENRDHPLRTDPDTLQIIAQKI